ncbi:hypothetical protein BVX95_01440 [archaeon D22]|nr:hypothetical protein BVX95_01440 [archaeon D22]
MYAFWKLWFLRNPDRKIPKGEDLIICPADGKVIEVIPFNKTKITFNKGNKRIFGQIRTLTKDIATEGYMISIFMNPFDVHYNRAPISGDIKSVMHKDGKLLAVNSVSAGLENEKTETIIQGKKIKIKVIQIAGFLARRIETFVQPKDKVKKGDVYGLINLGSQVTIITPRNVEIEVKKGQRVKAGETIIGKIK